MDRRLHTTGSTMRRPEGPIAHAAVGGAAALLSTLLIVAMPVRAERPPCEPVTGEAAHIRHRPLQWTADGRYLVAGGAIVLDPRTGAVGSLPVPMALRCAAADVRWGDFDLVPFPTGSRVLWTDGHRFRVGSVTGPFTEAVPIPDLLGDGAGPDLLVVRSVLVPIDDRHILLRQQHRYRSGVACRIHDVVLGRWGETDVCPQGSLRDVRRARTGPGGWWVIHSTGEGHPGLKVYRAGHVSGEETGVFEPDLYPAGPAEATVSRDGTVVWISSPCPIDEPGRRCLDIDAERRQLYAWDGERLVRLASNLPPGAVASPTGEEIAWPDDGRICVARLDRLGAPRCHDLGLAADE